MGEKPIKREVNLHVEEIDVDLVLKELLDKLNLKLMVHEWESGQVNFYSLEKKDDKAN